MIFDFLKGKIESIDGRLFNKRITFLDYRIPFLDYRIPFLDYRIIFPLQDKSNSFADQLDYCATPRISRIHFRDNVSDQTCFRCVLSRKSDTLMK